MNNTELDYTRLFIGIAVMAVMTYLPRMLPLVFFRKKIKSQFIQSFLSYVPYAVMAAMTFPGIFYSTESVFASTVGLIVCLVLIYFNRNLVTIALGATGAVFLIEQITKFFF